MGDFTHLTIGSGGHQHVEVKERKTTEEGLQLALAKVVTYETREVEYVIGFISNSVVINPEMVFPSDDAGYVRALHAFHQLFDALQKEYEDALVEHQKMREEFAEAERTEKEAKHARLMQNQAWGVF
ncbi:MAG: hypothetical protein JJ979_02535 [Roseibium sp.]|nr:hypothetical protein [Roseibium sp.]